jgi:hypothetical protein
MALTNHLPIQRTEVWGRVGDMDRWHGRADYTHPRTGINPCQAIDKIYSMHLNPWMVLNT